MSTHIDPHSTGASTVRDLIRLLSLAVLAAALCGCVYRMNIQQGNFLEARKVEQLEVGMTRSQVRYLLGTPMVPDSFNNDRWDYLYYMKRGRAEEIDQQHLTVYFEGDKVARIDRHGAAPANADTRQDDDAPASAGSAREDQAPAAAGPASEDEPPAASDPGSAQEDETPAAAGPAQEDAAQPQSAS